MIYTTDLEELADDYAMGVFYPGAAITEEESEAREQCRKLGHQWDDHSSAGPNSGNMDLQCSRCGYYKSIPLY